MSSQQGQSHRPKPEESSAEAGGATLTGYTGPVCPACGSHNREQSQFCSECGAALLNYCPQCGRQISPDEQLCSDCAKAGRQIPLAAGRCQSCGWQNDQGVESCRHCGARLLVKCPHCGAVTPASFSFCPRCGFDYSRFVTDRLVRGLPGGEEQGHRSGRKVDISLALMVALSVVSVLVMIYILSQI
jgi:predicted nucleic acid-binding Zn ribbon protein